MRTEVKLGLENGIPLPPQSDRRWWTPHRRAASRLAVVVLLRTLYLGVGLTVLAIAAWAVPALPRRAGTTIPLPEP